MTGISHFQIVLLPAADTPRIDAWVSRGLNIALLSPAVLEDSLAVSLLHQSPHLPREHVWVTPEPLRHLCLGNHLDGEVPLHVPAVVVREEGEPHHLGLPHDLLWLLYLPTVEAEVIVDSLEGGVLDLEVAANTAACLQSPDTEPEEK